MVILKFAKGANNARLISLFPRSILAEIKVVTPPNYCFPSFCGLGAKEMLYHKVPLDSHTVAMSMPDAEVFFGM